MNNKIKKIIAREFLLLIFALLIGVLTYLCVYPYNAYKRYKIESYSASVVEKTKLSDSLSRVFNAKQHKHSWFFYKVSDSFDITTDTILNTKDKLWKRFDRFSQNDSIVYRWKNKFNQEIIEFFKSIGFKTPEYLNEFIVRNRISKLDSSNFILSNTLKKEVEKINIYKIVNTNQILTKEQQVKLTLKVFLYALILIYGVRYFIYAILWSIKTIKQ